MNGTKLVGHSGPVYSVDLSFCGRYVLSGSEDGTVRLWSLPLRADLVSIRFGCSEGLLLLVAERTSTDWT